jgi:phage shock protein A
MGMLSRLGSLLRANVDDLITRSEDPEKMLNQALLEMGHQLIEARKQVIVSIADERRFRKMWEAELTRARSWKDKAKLAVLHGDDSLAKEALLRRREHEELAAEYQRQWESQKRSVDQLKDALRRLDAKLGEAKRKKGLLVAKQRRALAQQAIQETLSGLSDSSALETFRRMEVRIEQLEAEAEASAEMQEQLTGDTLAQKLEALEASSGLDLDLLELKDEMGMLPRAAQAAAAVAALPGDRRLEVPDVEEEPVLIEVDVREPARARRVARRRAAA